MFNILGHKGNENQNIIEIPSHSSQNSYCQGNKQQTPAKSGRGLSYAVGGNVN
jgi:hypothetical protein